MSDIKDSSTVQFGNYVSCLTSISKIKNDTATLIVSFQCIVIEICIVLEKKYQLDK